MIMCDEAEYLGLPYSPPSIKFTTSLPLTGLNYASGICGILPETGRLFVSNNRFSHLVGKVITIIIIKVRVF